MNHNSEEQIPEIQQSDISEEKPDDTTPVTDSTELSISATANETSPQEMEPDHDVQHDSQPLPNKEPCKTAYTYRWDYHTQYSEDASRSETKDRKGKKLYAIIFASAILISVLLLIGVLWFGKTLHSGYGNNFASLSEIYDECLPSYVAIHVETPSGEGVGSGIIMTSDGYIATNYHVIADATSITVIMSDNSTYEATMLDGDETNDIAVIKVDARGLTAARVGSSVDSRVGDQVMAIGTPFSIDYRGTMTSGYISALNRRFVEENANGTVGRVMYLIQTDTSVNPGNSGGPLFNMNGEVIGIVSLKISGNNYEGLGFAIPIESVTGIIEDIMEHGKITQSSGGAHEGAALGISGYEVKKGTKYLLYQNYHFTVQKDDLSGKEMLVLPSLYGDTKVDLSDTLAVTEALAEYLPSVYPGIRSEDIDPKEFIYFDAKESGVCVIALTEGFDIAKKLEIYDIIVSADGISCAKMATLKSLIADKKAGDEILFTVYRNGELINIKIALGKASEMSD